ncbi:unnamed protein product [Bursaphelenchus xylophilus]|uniref:(pine wood nematode) hypothetical protein n=1 Tax=Bursaphelenchus xylophilus TaxID=6326 RepID=A0A1I7RYF8_BURXY|nr:unnamed protein product [Bursaphelenchus xylophilus]CAG9085720.1 unnamed protein product [Bursaphelenchus xylophilus]
MQEITIESLAKKEGNEVRPTSSANKMQSIKAPSSEKIQEPKNPSIPPLSTEKILNEIREFDFNYRWYFTILALEFVFVTLVVVAGFVLIGYYSEWKFE